MRQGIEIKAGTFVIVALLLFALFVWVLGSERQIFSSQQEYYALFKDVKGLADGAPVRLGGITIGRVSKINFSKYLNDPNITVELLINEGYLERLRSESLVTIETQGLLGDRFMNISMSSGGRALPPGSTLKSEDAADIAQVLQKAQAVVDNTVKISESVSNFLGGQKENFLLDLSKSAKSLGDILTQIETGNGLLHGAIYGTEKSSDAINQLSSAAADVSAITKEIRTGNGLLHYFVFHEDGKQTVQSLGKAAENLATLSAQLSEVTTTIKSGPGLFHDMIYAKSPSSVADILLKIDQTVNNFKQASEALSNGSGTIGALLVDPSLYDNLVEVTDGAKRSFLLRQAIKSSLKK